MKKRSKILITLSAACLVAAIGATMAYFFADTETKTNAFTLSKGINIKLAEPKWDNKDYDGAITGTIPTAYLGETKAQNFVPGREIPKDPSVKNVSEDNNSVWIAIKLDYTINNSKSTYSALSNFANIIGLDSANWEANSDYSMFYYKAPVEPGKPTTELFQSVKILENAGTCYPFVIDVTAYAMQSEGVAYESAKTELAAFAAAPRP